ncbi:MAG TPA: hypothetical protein VGI23_02975 [Steroidobacteraceae bacterium]
MRRIAFASLSLAVALAAQAQTPEPSDAPEIQAVIGAPFSDTAVEETTRVMQDGTRFVHSLTTRHYRSGQGSVRSERELPIPGPSDQPHTIVTINNKVTGELVSLFPSGKMASVMQRTGMKVVDTPVTLPEIRTTFAGMRIGPTDPGWSAPVSLGEKTLDGVHVVGSQRAYTVAAGKVGNSKAVTVTVQQWSSPELGIIVDKLVSSTTGGQFHYHLTQLTQAEPDAALFTVPADYKKILVKRNAANGVEVETASTPTTASR